MTLTGYDTFDLACFRHVKLACQAPRCGTVAPPLPAQRVGGMGAGRIDTC